MFTSVDFRNKEILAELKKRDSAGCATQEILDTRLADYKRAQETEMEGGGGDGGGGYSADIGACLVYLWALT